MTETQTLDPSLASLVERFQEGRKTALARAISVVEDERPGYQGMLEMIPATWVFKLANPETGQKTDLSPGGATLVSITELWENMQREGMRDPFILSAGLHSRTARLEAGNHRIKLFVDHNVPYVPATVLVSDGCIISEQNGSHEFRRKLLPEKQDYALGPYAARTYKKPSDVFAALHTMKRKGMLPVPIAR